MKQVRHAESGQTMRNACCECCSLWIEQWYLATLTYRGGDCTRSKAN
ncbi:MAG: hypothetical protein JWP42_1776 [Pseudomonas sp.]|nr:hypothetical protein [Pseudomonas sp.]